MDSAPQVPGADRRPAIRPPGEHPPGGADPLAEAVARAAFEHALDAMLLADDGRRYIDANSAACSLLGLPYEEVVTRRLD
ncbi:MAG: PAS domain-containing protein, partial [Actinomycetota bacterium]|nr:PAS domain-containing protein [Actinomycetota bacterium]